MISNISSPAQEEDHTQSVSLINKHSLIMIKFIKFIKALSGIVISFVTVSKQEGLMPQSLIHSKYNHDFTSNGHQGAGIFSRNVNNAI